MQYDPTEASLAMPTRRSWRLCRCDRFDPAGVAEGGPIRNGDPRGAVSFAESVSLSSTVLVDLRLPPPALGLGFVLLALRARRARESRWPRVPAQEVRETKMSQFGGSALRNQLQARTAAGPSLGFSGRGGKATTAFLSASQASAFAAGPRRPRLNLS